MKTGKRILQNLNRQKERKRQGKFEFAESDSSRCYRAEVDDHGVIVAVDVLDFDKFGVMLEKAEARETGASDDSARFHGQVEAVGGMEWGLQSSFELIERDGEALRAIFRTTPQGVEPASYFELELSGGKKAAVRHFQVENPGKPRELAAANLGAENFIELVDRLRGVFAAGID